MTFVPVALIMLLFRNSNLRVSHMTLLRGVVEDHLDEELDDDDYKNSPSAGDSPPQYSFVSGYIRLSIIYFNVP